MKKSIVLALSGLIIAAIAALSLLHRRPNCAPPEEASPFQCTPAGAGILVRFQSGAIPLRAFRWLRPLPGGLAVAQILTQTGNQRVALFQEGKLVQDLSVPQPALARDGFFRFAELRDAVLCPGDALVLLYAAGEPGDSEPPLTLALDLKTQELRWSHRARGERLALAEDPKDAAIFLFDAKDPVQRLPLALQKGEQNGKDGVRSSARSIELPPEIQNLDDLLPTGSWTFLAAHRGGLSAYQGSRGWTHHPLPADPTALPFPQPYSTLARTSRAFWWQPQPGRLMQVAADASIIATPTFTILGGQAWDARLLRLLGADGEGRLWFGLTAPASSSAAGQPAGEVAEAHADAGVPSPSVQPQPDEDPEAWKAYAQKGLDRLYRWDPANRQLEACTLAGVWDTLNPPQEIGHPASFVNTMRPAAGALLMEGFQSAWWLPLKAIPMAQVGSSSPKRQAQLK